jgi:hypothetical protein
MVGILENETQLRSSVSTSKGFYLKIGFFWPEMALMEGNLKQNSQWCFKLENLAYKHTCNNSILKTQNL